MAAQIRAMSACSLSPPHRRGETARMVVVGITGASGFVGRALTQHLRDRGHDVRRFVRGDARGAADTVAWDPATGQIDRAAALALEAVVHLAGENLASGRWTRARMQAIDDSRGPATERLCRSLATLDRPPTLLSASAVGIYGDRGDERLDEQSPAGTGFLADVCRSWERGTDPLRQAGARVANLRIGLVLGRGGGPLAKMLPVFRLGLGGRLGSGRQWMSWIALVDLLAAIEFALAQRTVEGPVLCVSPAPVTNREFTAALGRALHRPAVLPVPAVALRLLLGRMADAALLAGQRAEPRRLEGWGFRFSCPDLASALRWALSTDAPS